MRRHGIIINADDGGKTWVKQDSGIDQSLFSVCFTDLDTGWVAGEFGTIIHTDDGGQTWVRQGEGEDVIYNRVFLLTTLMDVLYQRLAR